MRGRGVPKAARGGNAEPPVLRVFYSPFAIRMTLDSAIRFALRARAVLASLRAASTVIH
jgi:hypothetical protein